jgi:Nif-specific regulatory protein
MTKSDLLRLTTLLELSQSLGSTLNFRASLSRVLEILEEDAGTVSGTVRLVDEGGRTLVVEAASGPGHEAVARARTHAGEGLVGRVVTSGRPVVVPRASDEPLLPPGAARGARKGREVSFLCVPIAVDGRSVGALDVTLRYDKDRDYSGDAKLLAIVASMIGQAIRVNRLAESEKKRLVDENQKLRQELREKYELSNLVGNSRPMRDVYEQVAQAAPSSTTVLIRGESGTGKELIAHAIHYGSPRADKPFVKVSCAALPESLIESELFGYEPGAFTDARALKKGRFELASGGTIFLDEVGELSAATQVKLLRVLQEREFERLGGVHPIKVNVRLIAATNKDLETAMRAGTFREDLYYRLNVFSIFVPPLRDRRPDILLLADHFVEKYAVQHGKDVKRISTTAIDVLMAYHWPGNVRELENCVERAVLVCDGGVIHAHHLPPTLQTAEVSDTLPTQSLESAVSAFEKDLLLDGLKIARGNRARAARLLQTTERILGYKLKKYGIEAARFRV